MTPAYETRNRFFDQLCGNRKLRWMGQNTNHFDPHPAVLAAVDRSINDGEYHIYAPPLGLERLRELILADIGLPDASTMVTNGAVEGLFNVCTNFNVRGKDFITTDPSWSWPMNFSRKAGANVIQLPAYNSDTGYGLSIKQLQEAVTENTQMIYIVDPNNPLGTCHGEKEIQQIAELARSVGAYLVHDSTYSHFADDYVPAYRYYPEKTILTYSFSKWLGLAGMRLGAVIAAPDIIERLSASPPNNLGCNIVAQRAAIAGLETKAEWFPTVKQRLRRNQQHVHDAVALIPGLRVPVYPSQANFLIIETAGAGVSPEALVAAYSEHDIMIRQGVYHTKTFGDQFVKVSLTVPEEWVDEFCELLPDMVERAKSLQLDDLSAQLF